MNNENIKLEDLHKKDKLRNFTRNDKLSGRVTLVIMRILRVFKEHETIFFLLQGAGMGIDRVIPIKAC